jgi:hypothetical protein
MVFVAANEQMTCFLSMGSIVCSCCNSIKHWPYLKAVFIEVWQHAEVNFCCSKVLSNSSSTYACQPAGHHAMAAHSKVTVSAASKVDDMMQTL